MRIDGIISFVVSSIFFVCNFKYMYTTLTRCVSSFHYDFCHRSAIIFDDIYRSARTKRLKATILNEGEAVSVQVRLK